ncbi:hypothetical protein LTR08_005715 [Meristemomyces frigidus]|nr:hypothetical protein LTR08_005715 [Meristemomyces frigidus]
MLYPDLKERQFRLVSFRGSNEIDASLDAFDVDAAPLYVALSYQWGIAPYRKGRPSNAQYSITVNGEKFPVQENLHDALRHLHWRLQKRKAAKYSTLDNTSTAYLQNFRTGSWSTPVHRLTVRWYMYIDAICIDQSNDEEKGRQVRLMKEIYEKASKVWGWLGVPYDEEETRLAIQLMKRFNLALADGLARTDGDMNAASTQLSAKDQSLFPFPGTGTYKGWLEIMEMFNQAYWKRTWVQQEATGPAAPGIDKIYAPRNFAPDVGVNDLVPDYRRSLEDVYTDVVAFYLNKQQNLDALGHVTLPVPDSQRMRRGNTEAPLPSWVPDWRDRLQVTPLYKRSASFIDASPKVYKAAGPYNVLDAHINGKILVTSGVKLAQIRQLSSICENSQQSFSQVRDWAPGNTGSRYEPTGQIMDDAFRTTVVADVRFVAAYQAQRGCMARWDVFDKRIDEQTVEHRELRYGLDIIITQMCFGRRLAHTEDGYMGLVPGASQTGDTVCVLFGGSVLYVLRDLPGGESKLIGECYIHGLMDGEFSTRVHDVETFRII